MSQPRGGRTAGHGNGSRLEPRGGGAGNGGNAPTRRTASRGRACPTDRGGMTRAAGGGRRSDAIVVGSDDDDNLGTQQTPLQPPPAVARPAPPPDDRQLADDLAEAVRLDIDPDFIEQLRMMSPRSRATILTDVRGSAQPAPQPAVVPAPQARYQPPRNGRRGGRAHRQEEWFEDRRHGGHYNDHFDDSDDGWYDEDDDADMFPPPFFAGGRGGAGLPPQMQMQMMQAFLRGRGFGGQREVAEMLAQAQRAANEARAMGAHLDVDNMSYEELLALEERMGHVSKGLSKDQLQAATEVVAAPSTPSPSRGADADVDSCVICMTEFSATPDNDCRRIRLCGHVFHDICLSRWLGDNRRCPICNLDVV